MLYLVTISGVSGNSSLSLPSFSSYNITPGAFDYFVFLSPLDIDWDSLALQLLLSLHVSKVAYPWLLIHCYLVSNVTFVEFHHLLTVLMSHSLYKLARRLERLAFRLVIVLLHGARSRLVKLLLTSSVVNHGYMPRCDVPVLYNLVHLVRLLKHFCWHHLLKLWRSWPSISLLVYVENLRVRVRVVLIGVLRNHIVEVRNRSNLSFFSLEEDLLKLVNLFSLGREILHVSIVQVLRVAL